ncbi:MAG: HepT-like ribonuclease domain-containing protein [Anaerolineaceae bacterium]
MRDHNLYISDIKEAIEKIQKYVAKYDFESFIADSKTQDSVLHNLLIAGEAANKIPDSVRERYPDIDWRGMIGMRNIIVHGYFTVNPEIIWKTVIEKLPELLVRLKEIE